MLDTVGSINMSIARFSPSSKNESIRAPESHTVGVKAIKNLLANAKAVTVAKAKNLRVPPHSPKGGHNDAGEHNGKTEENEKGKRPVQT